VFLLYLTLGGWAIFELGLRVRELAHHRGGGGRDQATRFLIATTLGAAIVLASVVASATPSLRIPGPFRSKTTD
jgi:hypothetical protein